LTIGIAENALSRGSDRGSAAGHRPNPFGFLRACRLDLGIHLRRRSRRHRWWCRRRRCPRCFEWSYTHNCFSMLRLSYKASKTLAADRVWAWRAWFVETTRIRATIPFVLYLTLQNTFLLRAFFPRPADIILCIFRILPGSQPLQSIGQRLVISLAFLAGNGAGNRPIRVYDRCRRRRCPTSTETHITPRSCRESRGLGKPRPPGLPGRRHAVSSASLQPRRPPVSALRLAAGSPPQSGRWERQNRYEFRRIFRQNTCPYLL
jgi:hypothetical protein